MKIDDTKHFLEICKAFKIKTEIYKVKGFNKEKVVGFEIGLDTIKSKDFVNIESGEYIIKINGNEFSCFTSAQYYLDYLIKHIQQRKKKGNKKKTTGK